MAVRSARASSLGSRESHLDSDAVIAAEGVSKRYPVTPVTMFPPVLSIFDREKLRRKRKAAEEEDASAQRDAAAAGAAPPSRRRDDDIEEDLDLDEEDDDEDEEEEEFARRGGPTPDNPGEMFWALKDVSFRVPRGAGVGVLGGPDAGKTTLLNILGGQAFPTEGRVLVRGKASPLPAALAKALNMTARGTFSLNLPLACRLLGVPGHMAKRYRDEIEELAQPIETFEGDPLPGAITRLSIATAITIPTNVILLDEPPTDEPEFMDQVVERVRRRIRRGSSLVLASRSPELARQLCDDAIVLDGGVIADKDDAKDAAGRLEATGANSDSAGRLASVRKPKTITPSTFLPDRQGLRAPEVVPAFNQSAALVAATLRTGTGRSKRIDSLADEVAVEISFETALPGVEAHCGVAFRPKDGGGTGIRLELPDPLRFARPGTYKLIARIPAGALRAGTYDVRADAVVAKPNGGGASVLARDIGRVRIVGDEADTAAPAGSRVEHWDGTVLSLTAAEWSIE